MANSDDDDDSHFCIKCQITITGLDNYVAHRKSNCGRARVTSTTTAESKANDYFFSSLCLQSSSKSGEPVSVKATGVVTRSKVKKGGKRKRLFDQDEESEDDDSEEEHQGGGKWRPGCGPPPGYTGGKWKPSPIALPTPSPAPPPDSSNSEPSTSREKIPPPDHTRGKWGPTDAPRVHLSKGNVYWCGACNRRLSSKLVYDRHIRSELHFKRSNSWPTQATAGKRQSTRTRLLLNSSLKALKKRYKLVETLTTKKRRGPIICESCHCKVWPHLMGKHLVSHYHCRHEKNKENSNRLVLQYIDSIVRQAPYQCGLCKFYCNTQHSFINHWASENHRQMDSLMTGRFWCSFCKFETSSSVDMGCHLVGDTHREVIAIINHSVPIIIRKLIPLECFVCHRMFRYNAQVRAHGKLWGHVQSEGTASDGYQEILSCPDCPFHANCFSSYQRHRWMKHKERKCFCRPCQLGFSSAEEAKKHRKKASHRAMVSRELRKCPHCPNVFPKIGLLKRHIEKDHPNEKHRCLICGEVFLVKQELSQHVRSNSCTFGSKTVSLPSDNVFNCTKCSFATESECDFEIHAFLHNTEFTTTLTTFECPKCQGVFKKDSLRSHMMSHYSVRPFSCSQCSARFSRQYNLKSHIASVHPSLDCLGQKEGLKTASTSNAEDARNRGKKFKCDVEGCIYSARCKAGLEIHLKTHGDKREFRCTQCSYTSKTKGQLSKHIKGVHSVQSEKMRKCPHCDFTTQYSTHLKRHLRVHSGAKPYKCPYCSYTCNLLENLRKHITCSQLHPGKSIYECRFLGCDYRANLAKDYKSHLVRSHGEEPGVASAHVAGLYQPAQDVLVTENPRVVKPRKRRIKTEEIPGPNPILEAAASSQTMEMGDEPGLATDRIDSRMPTLASIATPPTKFTEEEVIFIQFEPGEEEYDLWVPMDMAASSSPSQN